MTTPTTGRAAALTSLALSLTLAVAACGSDDGGGGAGGGSARKLAQAIDALAEPLSQVSAKLADS
jgi:hypothetical protein